MPFLEITTNQEYLEKRIRELARGGCMSEFKWNGGSNYKGKDWDESLPTDCAVSNDPFLKSFSENSILQFIISFYC